MTQKFRVLVTDFLTDDLAPERSILGDLAVVTALDAHDEADLIGHFDEADALMIYHNINLTGESIARLRNCKLIVRCGVGYDNVDRRAARARGIPVANVPDYGTEEVADSAIGLMLSLTRGTHRLNSELRRGGTSWSYSSAAPLYRLRGRVFGIVGLGRIGTATAMRARSLGMDVVFYDPYLPDGIDKSLGLRRAESLTELLGHCHVLSLHCPLTAETANLIDAGALVRMPRGSYLVNTARGGCVDPMAVYEAIWSGQLAGAALDVLPWEPPPDDHPLLAAWRDPTDPCHDRLILNPHAAFYCEEGLLDMRIKGARACRRALLGEPLRNVVN